MRDNLRNILAVGMVAATMGYNDERGIEFYTYDPDKLKSGEFDTFEVLRFSQVINADSLHYSGFVGRRMRMFNEETGLKGTLSFNILPDRDYYVLTKKVYWQNEVRGKTVPVHSEVDFYARVETPRVLDQLIIATLFDNEWYMTDVELTRKTGGNSPTFKRAEEIYLECLDALENPTINGRPRVAPISDGGI